MIVSGDRHLLGLAGEVPVLSPAEFLAELARRSLRCTTRAPQRRVKRGHPRSLGVHCETPRDLRKHTNVLISGLS